MEDLTDIIEDAVTDLQNPDSPEVESAETTTTPEVDATPDTADTTTQVTDEVTEGLEVKSPGQVKPVPDEFEKKFGIPQNSTTGRENRLPYSRVKKIVEKNTLDTRREVEATLQPKLTEYESKIKDYEERFQGVAQFEHVLLNDTTRFMQMLSEIPAYKPIFAQISEAFRLAQSQPSQPDVSTQQGDGMPEPDQKDGANSYYSQEGLRQLLTWHGNQVRDNTVKQVTDQFSQRFGPIEQDWQAREALNKAIPEIQSQISTARKWNQFSENEQEIIQALQSDSKLSLEGAYLKVVMPKLQELAGKHQTDEAEMKKTLRKSILEELKNAPTSTSVSSSGSRPGKQSTTGSRSLEDIITEAGRGIPGNTL